MFIVVTISLTPPQPTMPPRHSLCSQPTNFCIKHMIYYEKWWEQQRWRKWKLHNAVCHCFPFRSSTLLWLFFVILFHCVFVIFIFFRFFFWLTAFLLVFHWLRAPCSLVYFDLMLLCWRKPITKKNNNIVYANDGIVCEMSSFLKYLIPKAEIRN